MKTPEELLELAKETYRDQSWRIASFLNNGQPGRLMASDEPARLSEYGSAAYNDLLYIFTYSLRHKDGGYGVFVWMDHDRANHLIEGPWPYDRGPFPEVEPRKPWELRR